MAWRLFKNRENIIIIIIIIIIIAIITSALILALAVFFSHKLIFWSIEFCEYIA
jgi:hypothetical protein